MYSELEGEQEELEPLYLNFDKNNSAMEEAQIRPTRELTRRLTDYEFLLGKNDQPYRRETHASVRAKKSHRATVMVPQVTRITSGPVGCHYVVIWL